MAVRTPFPGPDAPTPARIGTCRPMGRSHFSFDGERKVCKRKPAARHSRGGPRRYAPWASVCGALWAVLDLGSLRSPAGKKASTAHFDGGARNVARNLVGQITPTLVRAPVLAFFRRQNGRAFFPSLPNAALLPRSWRWAYLESAGWDASLRLGWACNAKRPRRPWICRSRRSCSKNASWDDVLHH